MIQKFAPSTPQTAGEFLNRHTNESLILTLNAGSSTLKAGLFQAVEGTLRAVDRRTIEQPGDHAVAELLDWAQASRPGRLTGVGHRVVHGGMRFAEPVLLDDEVLSALEALIPLAPLHQPRSLDAVRSIMAQRADLAQAACFDTAFHRNQPAVASWLGLPRALHDKGVRRYGFHGLSYQYVTERLRTLDPALAAGRLVIAHLGSGASACAVRDGGSLDSSMGFSPLDGLLMSTRPGSLDAGAVLHLLQHEGMSATEVEDLLYRRSGLLGVSGVSGDMRILLAAEGSAAREAVDLFVYRAAREMLALTAALGELDGVVFTGGVGENSAEIRARICQRLAWIGLELDIGANRSPGEGRISHTDSPVQAWVVPTDEEQLIARQSLRLFG